MNALIQEVEKEFVKTDWEFRVGDTVRIHMEIAEGDKKRLQAFEGIIIRQKGASINKTITIRKITANVGIEKIIPVNLPSIKKVDIIRRGKVRRAKLFYLRELTGKAAMKVKEDLDMVKKDKEKRLSGDNKRSGRKKKAKA